MKRIVLGAMTLAATILAGCGGVSKEEAQQMQNTNDSLMLVALQQGNEIADLSGTLNDLSNQLDQINGQISISNGEDQDLMSQRERIMQKLANVQQTIAEKQQQLEDLQKKYNGQLSQNKELKKTIDRLQGEVAGYQKQIDGYKSQIILKDQQIAGLTQQVDSTTRELTKSQEENQQAQVVIGTQDKMLNTAYYVVASKAQLKELGLIEGGLFSAKRLTTKGFSADKFTMIDIRELSTLPLESKSAKLLSSHPEASYELQTGEDKQITLVIKDASLFWSNTRYLVVMQ